MMIPTRQRAVPFGGLGVLVAATAAVVVACGDSSSSSLPPKKRFIRDVAAAGIISTDPNSNANLKLPPGPGTDDAIYGIATDICNELKSGKSKDGVAMKVYEDALDASLVPGGQAFTLPHSQAVKLVDIAIQDVCSK